MPPNSVFFKFNVGSVKQLKGRTCPGSSGVYKVIPNNIAFDVNRVDAERFEKDGLGVIIKGKIPDGTTTYRSLNNH